MYMSFIQRQIQYNKTKINDIKLVNQDFAKTDIFIINGSRLSEGQGQRFRFNSNYLHKGPYMCVNVNKISQKVFMNNNGITLTQLGWLTVRL